MRIAQYRVYRPQRPSPTRLQAQLLKSLRLPVWLLVLATMLVVLGGWRYFEETAALEQAREALFTFDLDAVDRVLDRPFFSPNLRGKAAATRSLTLALQEPQRLTAKNAASQDYPCELSGIIAGAFAQGRFDLVLRLDQLARERGEAGSPVHAQAALVELGRDREIEKVAQGQEHAPLRVSLARHLRQKVGDHVFLRDREGHFLGRSDGALLSLAPDIEPPLVPRFAATLPQVFPAHGALDLTLDLEISRAALRSLDRFRGSIVVLDPHSGEILAAVSDAYTFALGGSPALDQMREPASIAKLLTTTAALRAGVDPDHYLANRVCRGQEHYDGEVLYCPSIAGRLRGLDKAMAVSCNVAFASLGVEIGRQKLLEEYRRFGFDRPLGLFTSGHVLQAEGNARQLADLAIGLEATEITPLHAAAMAAIIANDGKLAEPHLVRASDGRLGFHRRELPPAPVQRVLEPQYLPMIRRAMAAVVERGTANRVMTPGFPVAMKTGTASDPSGDFHVNYIGYGPLGDDRLAFCVRITNQGSSRHVRSVASVVTANLLEELYAIGRARGWRLEEPTPAASNVLLAQARWPSRPTDTRGR